MDNQQVLDEVQDLRNIVENIQAELEEVKSKQDAPAGEQSISLLLGQLDKNALSGINSDVILETVWNDFLYINPTFVDFSRYNVGNSTGSYTAIIDDTGLDLDTGTVLDSAASASLGVDDSVITRTRETRFKAFASVNNAADITAEINTLGRSGNNSCGFRFLNGSLYGRCDNASTESTILLGTYSANTFYALELFYYPQTGVKFLVDGVEKGGLATNLPTSTIALSPILLEGSVIGNVASVAVTVTIASPAVFTSTAHGLAVNDGVVFSSTGLLPTGLTVGTQYYVITAGLTANTFRVSTSMGGAVINTSGSQSGTHTYISDKQSNRRTLNISSAEFIQRRK